MVRIDLREIPQEELLSYHSRQLQDILMQGQDVSRVAMVLNFGVEDNSLEAAQRAFAFIELARSPLQALSRQHPPVLTQSLLQNPIVVHFFTRSDWVHNPNIKFIANTVGQSVKAATEGRATINSVELHSPASCRYFCIFCYKVTETGLKGIYERARNQGIEMVNEEFWHQFIGATLESRGEEANKTYPFTILQSGCADTEPTLVPFFTDFLANSRRRLKGRLGEETARLLRHEVYTIGIALRNPKVREAILKYVDHVRVTIFSPDPNEYAEISGLNANAFSGVIKGVEALIEDREKQGLQVEITSSYLVTRKNYKSLKQMLELYGRLGVDALTLRSIHGETLEDLSLEEQAECASLLRDIYTHRDTFPFRINFGYTAAALALGTDNRELSTLSPNTVDMQMLNTFYGGPLKLTLTQAGILLGFTPGSEGGNFIPDEMSDSPFSLGKLDIRDAVHWPQLMVSLSAGQEATVNDSSVRRLRNLDINSLQDRARVRRITTGSILAYKTLEIIAGQPLDEVKAHPYFRIFNSDILKQETE